MAPIPSLRGQVETMNQAYGQLSCGLAGAIVLIYLLIVVNFQSWLDPFVIVSALPGALAGIVWMLFPTDTTLSVPALDRRDHVHGRRDRKQHSRRQLRARKARQRATTPRLPRSMLALHVSPGVDDGARDDHRHVAHGACHGEGGEQNAPLGRAVIGGLLVATVATLFFVPTIFSLLHSRHDRRRLAVAATPTP